MPDILIVMFFASAAGRLEHIDSVRFDNEKACRAALAAVNVVLSEGGEPTEGARVRGQCVAAAF
jgi:hypothetical protein